MIYDFFTIGLSVAAFVCSMVFIKPYNDKDDNEYLIIETVLI